jgi:TolA-binding protein
MRKVARHAKQQALKDGNANMSQDPIETARELATHANDIKHLQQDMDKMVSDMDEIKKTLQSINAKMDKVEGGWKALMWIGGAVSGFTAFIGYLIGHWRG